MATTPFVIVPSLCAVAVMYRQGKRIADDVLPRVPVDTESFRYIKYGLADSFNAPDTRVGRLSAPNQITWGSTEQSDSVNDEGLDSPVPNKDILAWQKAKASGQGMVSQADPLAVATEMVMETVENRREVRAANLVFNAANYAAGNKVTLSGTGQWSDYTNSDPLVAIKGYFDTMIVRPNIGVLGRLVATKLCMHPKVVGAVFKNGTTGGSVPIRALADQLELDELYVGDAFVNTAAPGQAASMSRVWGKHASFMFRDKQANTRGKVTFGYTAQYGDRIAGTMENGNIGLRGGVMVRAGESVKELITANDLGYLVQNAVA